MSNILVSISTVSLAIVAMAGIITALSVFFQSYDNKRKKDAAIVCLFICVLVLICAKPLAEKFVNRVDKQTEKSMDRLMDDIYGYDNFDW